GREALAESILEQALAIEDDNAELHFLKAKVLKQTPGTATESIRELERAVELEPTFVKARVALARQLIDARNYAKAVEHLEAAHRLMPGSTAVRLNLADAYRANEQYQK